MGQRISFLTPSSTTEEETESHCELYDLCMYAILSDDFENLRQWLNDGKEMPNKEAAMYQDDWNRTPLHVSLSCRLPLDIIVSLVQHAPETLQTQDRDGWLPLHHACFVGASLETLNILVEAFPEGLNVENNHKKKPCDIISKQEARYKHLLHSAVGLSVPLVKLLLQAFPNSCMHPDKRGNVPLHHLCTCGKRAANWLDIIMILLEASPESFTVTDNHGNTPSQLLTQLASTHDENGQYLLHHEASKGIATADSLNILVRAYPESIAVPDYQNMLPFHIACLNTSSSIDVLMQFIQICPVSLLFGNLTHE